MRLVYRELRLGQGRNTETRMHHQFNASVSTTQEEGSYRPCFHRVSPSNIDRFAGYRQLQPHPTCLLEDEGSRQIGPSYPIFHPSQPFFSSGTTTDMIQEPDVFDPAVSQSGSLKQNCDGKKRKRMSHGEGETPREVVHVRAKRGQATDSHSLAERIRREKINEKLRCLQDLVPGCYKTMGMAVMLDVIINYVRSLQNQIDFLSMKLSAASLFYDFNSLDGESTAAQPLHGNVDGDEGAGPRVDDGVYGGIPCYYPPSWSL